MSFDVYDVQSPPFPRDIATVPRMLDYFRELKEWLEHYQPWADELMMAQHDQKLFPDDLPPIPDERHYLSVALVDMYQAWFGMRQLREYWDAMLRTHEESWDCQSAVIWRLRSFQIGIGIIDHAFVPPEVREMRQMQFRKEMQKRTKDIVQKLGLPSQFQGVIGIGGDDDNPPDDDQVNLDELFYGDSDDASDGHTPPEPETD